MWQPEPTLANCKGLRRVPAKFQLLTTAASAKAYTGLQRVLPYERQALQMYRLLSRSGCCLGGYTLSSYCACCFAIGTLSSWCSHSWYVGSVRLCTCKFKQGRPWWLEQACMAPQQQQLCRAGACEDARMVIYQYPVRRDTLLTLRLVWYLYTYITAPNL